MKKSSTGKRGTELSGITLDRSCPMTLADQLVERLKATIVRNRCQPGEVLAGPCNDLSRGCSVEDIVNTIAATAVQAI